MNRGKDWIRGEATTLRHNLNRVLARLSVTDANYFGVTIAAPLMPPARLFLARPREPAFLWASQPDFCEVSLGATLVCDGKGPDRFSTIISKAQQSLYNFQGVGLDVSATEPRLFGGFSFAPGHHASTHWSGLSDAEFTLPRILYRANSNQAKVTLFISRSETSDLNGRERCIDDLLGTATLSPFSLDGSRRPTVRLLQRVDNPHREKWDQHVTEASGLLKRGDLEKVVLAREMLLCCSSAPDVGGVVEHLLARGDGTVCFALRRGLSTFLGATPERLVSRRGSQIITEALAGSAASSDPVALRALRSGAKNQLEHSLVVRELVARLRAIGADLSDPEPPQLRQFGHLVHLHTLLKARKAAAPHVLLLGEQLHPTPAVGGIPIDRALEFIRDHEAFDRGRYASPVGWFDRNGDGELAVALRSGLLTGREVRIYAGAGLVPGSEPGEEWNETELKFRSFLDALSLKSDGEIRSPARHDLP